MSKESKPGDCVVSFAQEPREERLPLAARYTYVGHESLRRHANGAEVAL
jgi:hypothetical protein